MSKLFSAVASLVVAFIAYAMIGAPASSAADLKIKPSVVRAPRIVWVQVDLPETKAKSVRVDILTPKVNGDRERWQSCTMRYVGLGTYRCGLDVSASTPGPEIGPPSSFSTTKPRFRWLSAESSTIVRLTDGTGGSAHAGRQTQPILQIKPPQTRFIPLMPP